jgi:hypothetical protein
MITTSIRRVYLLLPVFLLLAYSVFQSSAPILSSLVFVSYLWFIYFGYLRFNKHLSPIEFLVLIWFAVGFSLQFLLTDYNSENYIFGTFNSVGRFNFSGNQYYELTLVSIVGISATLLGLATGRVLVKHFFPVGFSPHFFKISSP